METPGFGRVKSRVDALVTVTHGILHRLPAMSQLGLSLLTGHCRRKIKDTRQGCAWKSFFWSTGLVKHLLHDVCENGTEATSGHIPNVIDGGMFGRRGMAYSRHSSALSW